MAAWSGALCRCGVALALAVALAAPVSALAWSPPETVRVARMSVDYLGIEAVLRRVEITGRTQGPIAVSVDRIDGPAGTVPLWASARLRPEGGGWSANGVLASGPGDLVLRFSGTGLGGERPALSVRSEPVRLRPDGLQPASLWPDLGEAARMVRGTLGLTLDWRGGALPEARAALSIERLTFRTDYGPVGPIDGRIELDRLLPPRTAEPQRLKVEGVQLANLAQILEIDAFGAEGVIDGDILFSFTEDGRLYIDEAVLAARGPGALRYRPARPPAALAGQGAGVALLLQAVADFRFEALSATVVGYLDDELTVQLQLRGANPELYEGHPIELNVNLEAPVVPLIGAGRDALQLPEAVRRAIEQRPN